MDSEDTTFITTGIQEECHNLVWKIDDWFVVQQTQLALEKQTFQVTLGKLPQTRSKWEIGLRVTPSSTLGIYFKLVKIYGTDFNVAAKMEFHFKKPDGSESHLKSVQKLFAPNNEHVESWASFNGPESSWVPFLYRDENDSVKIPIKMVFLQATGDIEQGLHSNQIIEFFKKASVARLQTNQAALLANSKSADVKIVCGDDKELTAHRLILSTHCTVLESMLNSDKFAEGKTGIIKVEDISGKTMEILLHYLYTGELKSGWSDADTIVEFTYAAGKYQLTELLNLLDKIVGNEDDSVSNLVLLSLAQKLDLKEAECKLMERIVKLTNAAKSSADLIAIYEHESKPEKCLPAQD